MILPDFFLIFLVFIFLFIFFKKSKILIDDTTISSHKIYGNENNSPILLGGIYFLITIIFFYPNISLNIQISLILITILGLMSDKNILPNPTIRFILQIIIILQFVYFEELKINDLKYDLLNYWLTNKIFNLFFTVFCLAILVNGSNFLDGLNGLLSGYFLIVLSSLILLGISSDVVVEVDDQFLKILFFSLIIFFLFNIFGLVYFGDSGSYLISILIGFYLIKFNNMNLNISPYYIACLLWYPAFENFFSLVRRIFQKKKVSSADNFHLHQLVYLYFKSMNKFKLNKLNTISGLTLVFYNMPIMAISYKYSSHSIILICCILFNLSSYLFFYYLLIKKFKD